MFNTAVPMADIVVTMFDIVVTMFDIVVTVSRHILAPKPVVCVRAWFADLNMPIRGSS